MKPTKVHSVEEAMQKLEQYCAYQERCHQEVNKKLYDMRMIPEAIDLIIVHLLVDKNIEKTPFHLNSYMIKRI